MNESGNKRADGKRTDIGQKQGAQADSTAITADSAPHTRYQPKLYTGSSHAWALLQIARWQPHERILDVGVGSGVMGIELSKRGFTDIVGVEPDPETRARAQQLGCYRSVVGSVEELPNAAGFHHALALDVLEHVAAPDQLLKEITQRIVGSGTVLISVPNITHWALRLMLLAGYFRYAARGPLDRTHLRFFSTYVLEELIAGSHAFDPSPIEGSIVPFELMLPRGVWDNPLFEKVRMLRTRLAKEFPSLFAYQLLTEVKKRL